MKQKYLHSDCPEIAVVLDLSIESARGIMAGIIRFIRQNCPWNINLITKTGSQTESSSFKHWNGDGIIAHVPSHSTLEQILQKKCPAILLSEETYSSQLSKKQYFIQCDNQAIGKLAAEFFLQRHFQHLAYVSYSESMTWCTQRGDAFVTTLKNAGETCHRFDVPTTGGDWFVQREILGDWLHQLPKPLAIFAANDFRGRHILEICLKKGIPVPYEVAVLGVNNDPMICQIGHPSLSSVAVDWEAAGMMAAESLQKRILGEDVPEIQKYSPKEIVQRNSTEKLLVSDKIVVQILEFIRINKGQNIRVTDVLRQIPLSQRAVENRFKKAVGHSIMEEIKQIRMQFICQLLRETELSVNEIAWRCGFENANHLGWIFKKEFGRTMGEYRKEAGIQLVSCGE